MPNFARTLDQAKSRDDAAKSFGRLDQWSIKDGETSYLRLISEDTISVGTHRFIPTKPQPEDCKWTKWPGAMWAICARDSAFRIVVDGEATDAFEDGYGQCYIHDKWGGVRGGKFNKDQGVPDEITYGLAVVRKVVPDLATGRIAGFTDETFEHRLPDGQIVKLPRLVIVAQKFSQFWNPVRAGAYMPPYSICDKDWIVDRKGNDLMVTGGTPTPELKPGTPLWARYDKAITILDASLDKYVLDHSNHDHYARFFIEGESPAGGYGRGGDDAEDEGGAASAGPVTTPANTELPQDQMDAFRQSLSGRAPGASAETAATATAAAAAGIVQQPQQ